MTTMRMRRATGNYGAEDALHPAAPPARRSRRVGLPITSSRFPLRWRQTAFMVSNSVRLRRSIHCGRHYAAQWYVQDVATYAD